MGWFAGIPVLSEWLSASNPSSSWSVSVHPVFGISQNLQDFCFFGALQWGVHVLPPARRGETHSVQLAAPSSAPGSVWTGVAFSKDAKLHTLLILLAQITDMVTNHKFVCSVKTNNNATGGEGRNISFIFYQLLKRLEGQWKRKEQCPIPHKACRFICKNLLAVSYDTLVSQGRWVRKGTHRILTVRTQDLFPESELEALQVFVESWF